jgi:chaperone modulatory protein CbpM
MADPNDRLETRVAGDSDWIAAAKACQLCLLDLNVVAEFVELGVVVSRGSAPEEWLLPVQSLPRLRVAGRLMRDLGLNVTGAALAVELLESQRDLERRIRRLEGLVHDSD